MEIIASTVGLLSEIREFTTSTFTRLQGLASSLNFLLSQMESNNTFNADSPKACVFGFAPRVRGACRLMRALNPQMCAARLALGKE